MKPPPSLRWRLVRRLLLLHLLLTAIAVAAMVFGLWAAGQLVDETGQADAEVIARHVAEGPDGALILRPSSDIDRLQRMHDGFWFVLRDAQGRELRQGEPPASVAPLVENFRALTGFETASFWRPAPGKAPDVRFTQIDTAAGPAHLLIDVGRRLTAHEVLRTIVEVSLVISGPIALFVGLLSAPLIVWVVRRTLAPMTAIVTEAERINIDRQDLRLPLQPAPREIIPLVSAVNDALDRLEEGYARQARFMADAAHELRTPVAILQARLETLPPGPDRIRLLRDVTRLALLCEQLLDLQRLDRDSFDAVEVDLGELAAATAAELAPLVFASGRQIAVEATNPASVPGADRSALERAVSNLVLNALHHGDGRILLRVSGSSLFVEDDGAGIPAEEQARVFEPFHRLHARTSGAGLGLALVKEIISRHGGAVTVGSSPSGGASIHIRFQRIMPDAFGKKTPF